MIPQITTDDAIFIKAVELGCNPLWADGIFGWGWHCGCARNEHGMDSQCSLITLVSVSLIGYAPRNIGF
jgi:hypothetical protein